jgi:transcription initiation factor TFIID TATA-box-binding protein
MFANPEAPQTRGERDVRINNVIAHSMLGCATDISLVAVALNGRTNPRVFPACVCHCYTTHTTLSLFDSGKLVVVGAKSEQIALEASHIFANSLSLHLELPVNVYNFEINNVVGHFVMPCKLNINLFLDDHDLEAQWDPDNFAGISYKPWGSEKGVVSFVLFDSGKGILTGGKARRDLYKAYELHVDDLFKYRLGQEYRTLQAENTRERPWIHTQKAKAKPEPKAQLKAQPKAQPKVSPKAQPKAAPKAQPKAQPKAALKAQPKAQPKAAPKAAPKAQPKAAPKPELPVAARKRKPESVPEAPLVKRQRASTSPPLYELGAHLDFEFC